MLAFYNTMDTINNNFFEKTKIEANENPSYFLQCKRKQLSKSKQFVYIFSCLDIFQNVALEKLIEFFALKMRIIF